MARSNSENKPPRIRLDVSEVAAGGGMVTPWLRHGAVAHNASSLATRGVTQFHPTWQLALTTTKAAVKLIRATSAGAHALGLG
jgi:hypothetical protein